MRQDGFIPRHARKAGPGAAFTLLELLAACTVTVVILAVALRLFGATVAIWRRSEQRTDTRREARAALDIMARDLGMTAAPSSPEDATLWLAHDPASLPEDRAANEEVCALVTLPFGTGGPGGDLCAVGYRCVWDDAVRCYVLKRRFLDGGATLAALRANAQSTPGTAPLFGSGAAVEEEVARYIWDLTLRPCAHGAPAAYPEAACTGTLPGWIEIRFKALGPAGAQKLRSLSVTRATWKNPADPVYKVAIAPFQQQFVTRVPLHAAPRE